MKINTVKHTLKAGGRVFGTFFFEFASTGIGRIASEAGAEFALFDMEHSGWSIETVRMLIATSRPSPIVPIVRVPATEYPMIARVLDMGAMGIMVPMVESVEQAQKLVACCKYPPEGRRGAAFGVAHDDYTGGTMASKIAEANREVLVIGQIETVRGLENVEAIAAVEGLDVLYLGQADLTTSMGIPGQYDHPDFLAAVDRILAACRAHNKIPAYLALKLDDGLAMMERGFQMITYNGDIWIYQNALRQGLDRLRGA